jgi:hypothetical protein
MPLFQPCPERARLLNEAASARHENDEVKRMAGMGISTLESATEVARASLHKAEMAVYAYLSHVLEHGCLEASGGQTDYHAQTEPLPRRDSRVSGKSF